MIMVFVRTQYFFEWLVAALGFIVIVVILVDFTSTPVVVVGFV